jgi:nicotinamide-nucleotide amidase
MAEQTPAPDGADPTTDLGGRIADAVVRSQHTVAAAESLTGGSISAALSAIGGASSWFLGAVVAYSAQVKYDLLGVERGPVINVRTAEQMAAGAARLLGADFSVAVTGVGGPGPQEDQAQGTVFVAVRTPEDVEVTRYQFGGGPSEIVEQAARQALQHLAAAIESYVGQPSAGS